MGSESNVLRHRAKQLLRQADEQDRHDLFDAAVANLASGDTVVLRWLDGEVKREEVVVVFAEGDRLHIEQVSMEANDWRLWPGYMEESLEA